MMTRLSGFKLLIGKYKSTNPADSPIFLRMSPFSANPLKTNVFKTRYEKNKAKSNPTVLYNFLKSLFFIIKGKRHMSTINNMLGTARIYFSNGTQSNKRQNI